MGIMLIMGYSSDHICRRQRFAYGNAISAKCGFSQKAFPLAVWGVHLQIQGNVNLILCHYKEAQCHHKEERPSNGILFFCVIVLCSLQ